MEAGKVGEQWLGDGLTPTVTPHVHVTCLGQGRRYVAVVNGSNVSKPAFNAQFAIYFTVVLSTLQTSI